jgi:hypothetical protein
MTNEKCQIDELGLGYRKCSNTDIAVTIRKMTKKDEKEDIGICHACWGKLAKNPKFYQTDELIT